jgi:signal transduction histidine kinase
MIVDSPHEMRVASRLAGIEGVVREQEPGPGRSLAAMLADGPLGIGALIDLACKLARTLHAVHARGVLHLNINPTNIIFHGPELAPLLIGFQLATTYEVRPRFAHHNEIRGDLAYIAPEQTGRTGRSVDLRADMYSFGAVLYESATGAPPFRTQDPLELVRDHLVQAPVPPLRQRPDMPVALSQIILRLLEKEPERRYQSTEGLIHDLNRVQRALDEGSAADFALGEHDFPVQLSAPSHPVGRGPEIRLLEQALDDAVAGGGRTVLVAGAAGVGKTSLINELRPMVTRRRGWFVSGKFDQYRHDAPTATEQALRALGRLLLAEPESELALLRARILHSLGSNAGLMSHMPEFAALLGPLPPASAVAEPAQAEARFLAATTDMIREIASRQRPIVMVLDDLQWAAGVSVRLIDTMVHGAPVPGFLLVCSYRDCEVDAAHAIGDAIGGWQRSAAAPVHLRLANLPRIDLQAMLQEMMRLPHSQAAALAAQVCDHTDGNPYDTVELLNALRGDGTLRLGPQGWEWDEATLRRYVSRGGVLELLSARIARLPLEGRRVLHVMACLGGQVRRSLLCAAMAYAPAQLDEHQAAPLEDGLLVVEPGQDSALRMRHDRVQQAVYGSMPPALRRALHLELARRLVGTPEFGAVALEQYLPACDDIDDAHECRQVASLLHGAALNAKASAHFALSERLLTAALSLVARLPAPDAGDASLRAAIEIDLHGAFCWLGRFEEADALYAVIEARGEPVENWLEAACAQIDSLQGRSRTQHAMDLGLALVRQLGLDVPRDFAHANVEQRLTQLGEWVSSIDMGNDPRPYTGDRRSTALVMIFNRLTYPAHVLDLRIMAWLVLEAQVIWDRHGPSPALMHALATVGGVAIGVNRDYRTGYRGALHAVKVGEARGWEPAASEARFILAAHAGHWFEPLENMVHQLQLARKGLMRNGELQLACLTYRPLTTALLDCCPTLEALSNEVETAFNLALRVRSEFAIAMMLIERNLLRDLRGDTGGEDERATLARASLERQSETPAVALSIEFAHALRAALFGDLPSLVQHARAAMRYAPVIANYRGAQARLMHAFALAQGVRAADADTRVKILLELDELRAWLAEREADAPQNFLHVLRWIEAERGWSLQDFSSAARAFDAAVTFAESHARPWHHALICERAGLFYLDQGVEQVGRQFIRQACEAYRQWGATRKVRQLESVHRFLEASAPVLRGFVADAQSEQPVDAIDTLALLRASQALSSETSLPRLAARVVELMGALTGATGVQFASWDQDLEDWFIVSPHGHLLSRMTVDAAAASGLIPLSAFRYAERTGEPLLVDDAAADDRFASDPYLAKLTHCALLVVPILNKGHPSGMLLLENKRSRGAFTTTRLDAVSLMAGQLAVSLENALLYDRLEQRVRDQTRELVDVARRAGMAQIAINVLHNVGNVLNSVNVSARLLGSKIARTRAARVTEVAALLGDESNALGRLIASDERARSLTSYLRELGISLVAERDEMVGEVDRLTISVDHIKNVVAMQLSYAGADGALEMCTMTELVDDALRLQEMSLANVSVERVYDSAPPVPLDRTRLMQIFVNLIANAGHATADVEGERKLHISVRADSGGHVVEVRDNGSGIAPAHLSKMFAHGFTTRSGGHGFGLHSSAVAAREMGGSLSVRSEGLGLGAAFTLTLPAAQPHGQGTR